jgi:hypothetical protein
VNQENATRLQTNNQILAATLDAFDAFAAKLGRYELRGVRSDEPRVGDCRLGDAGAFKHACDSGANGLDLGKLRHEPSLDKVGVDKPCSFLGPSLLAAALERRPSR